MSTTPPPKKSFVVRYLGPLVPLGFATNGVWIFIYGSDVYRPSRSTTTVALLTPDAQIAGVFFLALASLVISLGVSGRKERWFFRLGLAGTLGAIVIEGARQIFGVAVYG